MDAAGVEQTAESEGRPRRRRRFGPFPAIAVLAVAALVVWGMVSRDSLRERWLAAQSTETLERLDARGDNDALAHYVYASRLAAAGDTAGAWPPAARAATALPPSARDDFAGRIWAFAGYVGAQAGDARQAAAYLTAAERIRPRDPTAALGRGILLLRENQVSLGIAALTRAAELDPSREETWHRLGAAYLQSAETELALESFRRAAKLAPRDPKAHAALAEALGRLQQFDAAAAEARAAADLAPADPEYALLPAIGRASSARGQAEYEAGVQALSEASSRFPDVNVLHALLAGLHARFNQYGAARRELQVFLTHAPKDANGWLNLATLCDRLGDSRGAATANTRYRWIVDAFAEATRLKQQSLLHPSDPAICLRLSAALERCGKSREAIAALARASQLKPDDPTIPQMIASAQAALNTTGESSDLNRRGDGPR